MSASLAFRVIIAASALIGACSDGPAAPRSLASTAEGAAMGQAGSPSHSPSAGGDGVGGAPAEAEAGAGISAAGLAASGGSRAAGGAAAAGSTRPGNVPTGVTWQVIVGLPEESGSADLPSAASRGEDAAVAFVQYTATTPSTARVLMQRFGESGEPIGALDTLGTDPEQWSDVSLASDGKQYAACWTSAAEVHCSLVDEQGKIHLNVVAFPGKLPTIVASESGWVVAYAASNSDLFLQAFTPLLAPTRKPVNVKLSPQITQRRSGPLLARTPSGFALVGAALENGHEGLLRLSADLQPLEPAIPLGHDLWFAAQLVASDTRAAVSLSAPYGSYLLLLDETQVTAELPVAGGGKVGMDHALLVTEGGIGAAWLSSDVAVLRHFFADGHDSEIGLATHSQQVSQIGAPEEGFESYQQLLHVADKTVLVARSSRYGALTNGQEIRAAVLTFP